MMVRVQLFSHDGVARQTSHVIVTEYLCYTDIFTILSSVLAR